VWLAGTMDLNELPLNLIMISQMKLVQILPIALSQPLVLHGHNAMSGARATKAIKMLVPHWMLVVAPKTQMLILLTIKNLVLWLVMLCKML